MAAHLAEDGDFGQCRLRVIGIEDLRLRERFQGGLQGTRLMVASTEQEPRMRVAWMACTVGLQQG